MEASTFVRVPAGRLVRGTRLEEVPHILVAHADLGLEPGWILKEVPRTDIDVGEFLIARVCVTRAEWLAFCDAVGCAFDGPSDDHPVDDVSWAEAVAYCDWVRHETGVPVRLPTETEWERAARGDDAREFPWGYEYRRGLANLHDLGVHGTTPVGSFPDGASPFNVLDMAGNVDEWTSTVYSPYTGAPAAVPARESWAADPHVTRGGSYRTGRDLARCARRHGVYPPRVGAGLRLAMDA
jgi:toxoflavin biosynthesis protein ToxD